MLCSAHVEQLTIDRVYVFSAYVYTYITFAPPTGFEPVPPP